VKLVALLKRLLPPIAPAVILLALASLSVVHSAGDDPWLRYPWLAHLPLELLAAALLLGVFFRQFRVSLISLLIAASVLRGWPVFRGEEADATSSFVLLASVVLPLAATTLNLQKERNALSRPGLIRLGIVLVVAAALYLLPGWRAFGPVARSITGTWGDRGWRALLAIPPVGIGFLIASAACLVLSPQRRVGVLILQSLLFAFLGLNAKSGLFLDASAESVFMCFMTAAAAMLVWTVLSSAWRHAYMDELTGLPGRRPMAQHLASLGAAYSVAVVDVDHFKRVNDRYGHDLGDQVLRFLSAELRSIQQGKAYRYGGEEFVLVFGRGTFDQHVQALEDLKRRIAGRPFARRGPNRPRRKPEGGSRPDTGSTQTIEVTVSIGVARAGGRYQVPEEVMQAADKALYRAKKAGRNRVSRSIG